MTNIRVKFVTDLEAQFEECNGEARPLTEREYKDNEYFKNGKPVSYADYLRYYGNPDRHIYLGCVVQEQCDCCGEWKTKDSLWGIDVMDDDPSLHAVTLDRWMDATTAKGLPDYFGDTARELIGV